MLCWSPKLAGLLRHDLATCSPRPPCPQHCRHGYAVQAGQEWGAGVEVWGVGVKGEKKELEGGVTGED